MLKCKVEILRWNKANEKDKKKNVYDYRLKCALTLKYQISDSTIKLQAGIDCHICWEKIKIPSGLTTYLSVLPIIYLF